MDDGTVTNDDLIKLMWELYPNGPSLGLKIVLQSLAGRLTTGSGTTSSSTQQQVESIPDQLHPATAPVQSGVDTEAASKCGTKQAATQQEDALEKHKDDTSASVENTAGDNPVKNMPVSARERAAMRMGRNLPGKI